MNKQRKIYGAVLTLAASALGFDRFSGSSTPAPAEAHETAAVVVVHETAPKTIAISAKADKPAAVPASKTLAARLEEASKAQELRLAEVGDAFLPAKVWVAPKATSRNGAPEVKVDPVAEFRAHHHLTAIMKGGRTSAGLAIVDGKTLRPGQALDGLKLVSIREHSATFGADDVRVELSIETPTQLAGIERVSGKR